MTWYVFYEGRDGLRAIFKPSSNTQHSFPTREEALSFLNTLPGFRKNPHKYLVSQNWRGE